MAEFSVESNGKRETSKNLQWIPRTMVSKWTRQDAEMLHIKYDTKLLTSQEVLLKGGIKPQLTEEQSSYLHEVQTYLQGFNSSTFQFDQYGGEVDAEIWKLIKNLRKGLDMSDLSKMLKRNCRSEAIWLVKNFIDALSTLLKRIHDRRRDYRKYEGHFQEFVCVFAQMCLLKARICTPSERSVWENLNGARVTSEPGCRFYKFGFNDLHSDDMFSVIKVKKDLDASSDSESESRQRRSKRGQREQRVFWSTSSSTGPEDNTSRPQRKIRYGSADNQGKHTIRNYFDDRILGQHAGELLLDLHYYGKTKDKKLEFAMPGMIVDGTRVYMTILIISSSHYKKLKNNEELKDEDQAVIYYSTGHDILEEKRRNILMESFMSFNNAGDSNDIPIQGETSDLS